MEIPCFPQRTGLSFIGSNFFIRYHAAIVPILFLQQRHHHGFCVVRPRSCHVGLGCPADADVWRLWAVRRVLGGAARSILRATRCRHLRFLSQAAAYIRFGWPAHTLTLRFRPFYCFFAEKINTKLYSRRSNTSLFSTCSRRRCRICVCFESTTTCCSRKSMCFLELSLDFLACCLFLCMRSCFFASRLSVLSDDVCVCAFCFSPPALLL